MTTDLLKTPIEFLKGVGPKRAEVLKKELNIITFADLLFYFPFRYIDRTQFHKINEISGDSVYIQLKGKIKSLRQLGTGRAARLVAEFSDGFGTIDLVWFQGVKWYKDKFDLNTTYIIFGKPALFNKRYNIPHPDIEVVQEGNSEIVQNKLYPMYYSTEKLKQLSLDSKGISKLTRVLVTMIDGYIYENLSSKIIDSLKLQSRAEALIQIHFPENQLVLNKAILRLKFEEFFFIQLKLLQLKLHRHEDIKGHVFTKVGDLLNEFYAKYLTFTLTEAQKKVIREIRLDIGSGKQMNRLLQGDVGSGKTLVALMIILIALDNGFQASLMAPTEILANQHYNTFVKFLGDLPIRVEMLTGSTRSAKRKKMLADLANGDIHILIGTHALIEDRVAFKNLGLVVVDEQHRFGVKQRAKLWNKNTIPPHVLVMTATPIPRTLAMTLYGDLDVSVIDELPPGRKAIKTYHFDEGKRLRLFGFMKEQIKLGRQIYIVYPMIYESESLDLKHLMEGYDMIANVFPLPEYKISIVHGKMKAAEKEFEMQRFIKGETNIIVSTTVIEVGVDVPNASIMVIESAQRFGLSQLHQLRGRVGRGADQSYCILMTDYKLSFDAKVRIDTMVRSVDGFEISEVDLKLRGPGDIQGTQQSGMLDLKIADIVKDEKLLKYARDLATEVLNDDPLLKKEINKPLLHYLNIIKNSTVNWGMIS